MTDHGDDVPEVLISSNERISALCNSGKFDDAIRLCNEIEESVPTEHRWRLYSLKSNIYHRGGDAESAFLWVGTAISINSKISSLFYKRAIWFVEAGRLREAISDSVSGENIEIENNSEYYLYSFRLVHAFCLKSLGKAAEAKIVAEKIPTDYRMWLVDRQIVPSDFR